jgi:hypothetical protein
MITNQTKEAITHLLAMQKALVFQTEMAIAQAKRTGASWAEIAELVGGSRQAAQQRYATMVDYQDYIATKGLGHQDELDPSRWHVTTLDVATPEALGGTAKNVFDHSETEKPKAPATPERQAKIDNTKAPAIELIDGQTHVHDDDCAVCTGHPEDDPSRRGDFRAGKLDSSGLPVDWEDNPHQKCLHCGMPTHFNQSKKKFWFYPGCAPTIRDNAKYSN